VTGSGILHIDRPGKSNTDDVIAVGGLGTGVHTTSVVRSGRSNALIDFEVREVITMPRQGVVRNRK